MAQALDYTNAPKAIRDHVDPEDKQNVSFGLPGRAPVYINESGLYALVLGSRQAKAREFKRWVTSVVLPAISRDGSYVMGEEKAQSPEELAALLEAARYVRVNRAVFRAPA